MTSLNVAALMEVYDALKAADLPCDLPSAMSELYCQEQFGSAWQRAPRGAKAVDGWLNGQAVQIKHKERDFKGAYAEIKNGNASDDILLIVTFRTVEGGLDHIGPVSLAGVKYTPTKTGRRYSLRNIRAAAAAA